MASEIIRRIREESRYSVEPGYIQTLPNYEGVLHNIQMAGRYEYHNRTENKFVATCYNPYLIVLFRQEQLPVWDAVEMQDTTLDAAILYKAFVDGFNDGISFFDENYDVPSKVLYSSPEYVKTLKQLYYGDGSEWPEDHCLNVIRFCPITLELAQFRKIGHWSAIAFCIENLMQKHPGFIINPEPNLEEQSNNRDLSEITLEDNALGEESRISGLRITGTPNNEHKTSAQPDISATSQTSDEHDLKQRHRILIHFYEGGKMLERKHKNYNKYIVFSTKRHRLAYPNESQSKLKPLIKAIEKILPLLSIKARQEAELELNTLKGQLITQK